jgi:flagellar biosynthetic protein FlhB
MAEHDDSQEKTEEATPKRRQEAAEKGQVVRSRELTTLAMLLSAAAGLLALGPSLLEGLAAQMRAGLHQDVRRLFANDAIPLALSQALIDLLRLLAPFMAIMVVVALLAPLALGGWCFNLQSLGFKWERVSPSKGLARLFSLQALMELVKALAKFLLLGAAAVALLWVKEPELLRLGSEPLVPALVHFTQALGWIFLLLTLPMLLIAAVDLPFQLFNHIRQLRMTKQEVREEMKDTEGKPEVKSRIHRLQREFAQRRMMEKVPTADVIVTNPTHFAVALQYRQDAMSAPVMVAKGADLVAEKIRGLAAGQRIPRVESPLLARALYFNGELDKPIPVGLYLAVARVLAYVYQLRQQDQLGDEPIVMTDVPVPPDLRTE